MKSLFVFEGDDDDGCAGVVGRIGKEHMEDCAHMLKLAGYAASLFFVGVSEDDKVGTLDFEPVFVRVACEGGERDADEKQGREVFVHTDTEAKRRDGRSQEKFMRRHGFAVAGIVGALGVRAGLIG